MSDVDTKGRDEEDEAFGTAGDEATVKKTDPPKPPDKTEAEKKADEDAAAKKAADDEEARKKAEEDAPVTITKRQFDAIMADLAEAKSTGKAVQSLSGTVGNQKQEIEGLKKTTATLEITDADFEELQRQFPTIGEGVKKGLGSVLKRMTGLAKIPPGVGEAEIKKAIFEVHNANQLEILEDEFGTDDKGKPVWKTIVGDENDTDNKYRKWLAAQSEAYRKKINDTFSGLVVVNAIKRFQRDSAKAEKEEADRKAAVAALTAGKGNGADRRRAAVTPRGDGGGGPPPADDEESEDAGFEKATRDG